MAATQMSKSSIRGTTIDDLQLLHRVRFNSSGTFTKANYPAGRFFVVKVQAGGGGAGGADNGIARGSAGGGGGGFAYKVYTQATVPSTASVTVGAGGTGSSSTASNGASGGNSTFDTITAYGGGGGESFKSLAWSMGGGGGGADGDFDIRIIGQPAGNALSISNSNCIPNYISSVGGQGGHNYLANALETWKRGSIALTWSGPTTQQFMGNYGGLSGDGTPKTNNTGLGGEGRSMGCTGGQVIYGEGGDRGFVEVDIYG